METKEDDKLRRLITECGIINSDDDSSGSDWSPTTNKEEKMISQAAKRNTLSERLISTEIISHTKPSCSRSLPSEKHNAKTTYSTIKDSKRITNIKTIIIKKPSRPVENKNNIGDISINAETDHNVSVHPEVISPRRDTEVSAENLKRKLINPITGFFEDDELVAEPKKAKIIKDVLLNPETGMFEEVEIEPDAVENTNEKKTGKKKRKNLKSWKRNKSKEERLKNHIRRNIPMCRCKCETKINEEEAQTIFDKFIHLSSHTEQNIYLQGCVKEEITSRFRPRKRPARSRRLFKYMLKLDDRTVVVCSSAFLAIHGIKRDRLKKKVLQKHKDIADGRGKHDNRRRKITNEVINKVHSFISSLPTHMSHYCRTDNKHRKYLPANFSIAKLHRKFLELNPDLKPIMKYEKFREIFNFDFNISFGTPRKDICNTCEKFRVDIRSAELDKYEKRLKNHNTQKELHLRRAEIFFEKLRASEANTENHVLSICFDYQKNLAVPVTNIQDEYYIRQLWVHNFGVHNLKEGSATMYLSTENYVQKGPNEVITAINDYIAHNKKPEHTKLTIFCDNCYSQNKNKYFFTYLDQLCSHGVFENVTVVYPIPGHSMMPIDRDFAQIDKKRIREQTIYTPEFYVDMIKESRINKPFDVVFLEKNLRRQEGEERIVKVKDYKKLYNEYIKTITGIAGCREVKFSKLSRPALRNNVTGPYTTFTLYRVGNQRNITNEPENAYNAPRKLKPGKIKDIKHLLNYVSEDFKYFYKDIIKSDENIASSQTNNTQDEEDSEDDVE